MRIYKVFCVLSFILVSVCYSQDITGGLIGHFKLDGDATNSGSSDIVSGGTPGAGVEFVDAFDGQGAKFETSTDDVIKLDGSFGLTGSFTISAWVKGYGWIFTERGKCSNTYRSRGPAEFYIDSEKKLHYKVLTTNTCGAWGGSRHDDYIVPDITFTNECFTHVAVTVENNYDENRVVTFYINGQMVETYQSLNYDTSPTFDDPWETRSFIGGRWDDEGRFDGLLDDVRIYDRVLSSSELAILGRSGLLAFPCLDVPVTVPCTSLLEKKMEWYWSTTFPPTDVESISIQIKVATATDQFS